MVVGQAAQDPTPPQEQPAEEPFHDFRRQPLDYSGPESKEAASTELTELVLGWFGPSDPAHPLHGDLWVAASLAVEEANSAGGLDGVPFRLAPRWSESIWGSGVSQVARMAYDDRVLAVLGSVDGAATHLAEQIVAKARLPLVSPISTDESVNLAGVPWMFSVAPADHLWAPVLARNLVDSVDSEPFAMLTVADHDSRLASDALSEALAALGQGPAMRLDVAPGTVLSESHSERLQLRTAAALLLVAGPEDGARLLRAIRASGFETAIFTTPQTIRRRALALAGDGADGIRVPLLIKPDENALRESFAKLFRQRTGVDPDWAAMHTHDATRLLIEAVKKAGPSRTGIRSALVSLSPWKGITGTIEWDPTGQNRRPVTEIATVRDGRLVVE